MIQIAKVANWKQKKNGISDQKKNKFCLPSNCNFFKLNHLTFEEKNNKNHPIIRKCTVLMAAWLYPI